MSHENDEQLWGVTKALEPKGPDPDAEVHVALIVGEEEAVAEFEGRYRRQFIAHGIAKGMSREDAEDAWQEVFFRSVREAPRLTPLGEGLRKYAWGTMRNLVNEHLGELSARPESLDEASEAGPGPRARAPAPIDERTRDAVRRCLEALPPTSRAILEVLFVEAVPPAVLAERLGIPRNTVYKRKTRAITQIRPCLEEALDGN